MNPNELIQGCLHHDTSAQRNFYEQYSSQVMGICMRYAAGAKDTEAMALYVFKHLFEELSKCPADMEITKWVEDRTIWNAVKYLHQDKHRYFIAKTTRYMENKKSVEGQVDETVLSTEDSKKTYLAALQALTPSYRILYNLTYIDEVAAPEIIKNLEIAEETYKAELGEAKFQFKQYLNTYLHEQGLPRH
jgi:DNA-directed RNA polymerase specialized sigma24 family protein